MSFFRSKKKPSVRESAQAQKQSYFCAFLSAEFALLIKEAPLVHMRIDDQGAVHIMAPKTPLEAKGFSVKQVPFFNGLAEQLAVAFKMDPLTGELVALNGMRTTERFKSAYPVLYAGLLGAAHDAMMLYDYPQLMCAKWRDFEGRQEERLEEAIYTQLVQTACELIEHKEAPYPKAQVRIEPGENKIYVVFPTSQEGAPDVVTSVIEVEPSSGLTYRVEWVSQIEALDKQGRWHYADFMGRLEASVRKAHDAFIRDEAGFEVKGTHSKGGKKYA